MTASWYRLLYNKLPEGGLWIIPRSGMVFRKQDDSFVWVGTIPCNDPLYRMAPDFARDAEYEAAREHFATADIVVMKAGKLECYANAEAAKLRWKLKGKLVDLTKS
jgi:hypothetical protein